MAKAVISRRQPPGIAAATQLTEGEAGGLNVKIEHQLAHGLLVDGTARQLAALENQGFRVKLLPEPNILTIGGFRIDVEKAVPRVSAALGVTSEMRPSWTHHLVQLAGPPEEAWIRAIEAQGVNVVEPVSRYGLFVTGSPDAVAALENLPFVVWTGMFKPAYRVSPNLAGLKGLLRFVNITVYPASEAEAVRQSVKDAGGTIVQENEQPATYQDTFLVLLTELPHKAINAIAQLPQVRWIEFEGPVVLEDERSTQIAAENLNATAAPNTGPVVGYQASLTALGLDGTGVIVGICDTGVDTNDNTTMHADLRGRMVFFVDPTPSVPIAMDTNGHGTHVAGIAVGNATTGEVDPQGFLLGQGVAPGAQFGSVNQSGGDAAGTRARVSTMAQNGANVMNNSWATSFATGSIYTAAAQEVDRLVRDPDPGTAALENLTIVFSAGNQGPNPTTITQPKEAKNPIVVGNSLNSRPGEGDTDDIRGLRGSSSRGPLPDGRLSPTIIAPGTDIISTRSSADTDTGTAGIQRPDSAYTDTGGVVHQDYTRMSGTSMAAPHVTGLCALLIEWWRNRTGGKNPSPAMLKALLINGAIDCAGGPTNRPGAGNIANIPNNDQGWGRVSLQNMVVQAPASDRGPKIFSDQRNAFTANGQEYMRRVAPVDATRPLRITLVWTDAAGAVGASPSLVNDLDLEVTEVATGNVFRGNVFTNGFSTTGGTFDSLNNVECVYIQVPNGTYEVRVIAASISASARPDIVTPWQDFALVIDNADAAAADPVSVVPLIDHSSSMVSFGFVDVTRISSKQFVSLLRVDDEVGVVSFGTTAGVDFPTGASPTMRTVTDSSVQDLANTQIDGITFTGCTFMGAGIDEAANLLSSGTGNRAIVMLSDGYDNKGCDPGNPAKKSALQAVADLPADIPVFACAMGPGSDQVLLDQIATASSGRYYYMPTIDDLFEIYNFIREQVTSDGIIVNESATASSSRVGGFVDALATEVIFAVAWADTRLRYTSGDPRKKSDVSVRLRDPRGRLLHPDCGYVRRTVGQGYVAFKIEEPLAGQWFVEVETAGETHVRYTVGGFVQSPIRLQLALRPIPMIAGMPLTLLTRVTDGKLLVQNARVQAVISRPSASVIDLQKKHARQLAKLKPLGGRGDALPADLGRLLALRSQLLKDGKPDLFQQTSEKVTLRAIDPADSPIDRLNPRLFPNNLFRDLLPGVTAAGSGLFSGTGKDTGVVGSYNVVVTAKGVSPNTDTRFVRKTMASVVVR